MTISNSINANHKIAWKSNNFDSIEDVEIIGLPEIHNRVCQRIKNAELIHEITKDRASEKFLILHEFDESKFYSDQSKILNLDHTLSVIQTKIPCGGWDKKSEKSLDMFAKKKQMQNLKKASENGSQEATRNLLTLLKKCFPKEKESISKKNINSFCSKFLKKIRTTMYEDFQKRNYSMIETIERLKKTAKLIFVIAGRAHFFDTEIKDKLKQEAVKKGVLSLEPLYHYLQKKNAMILDQN